MSTHPVYASTQELAAVVGQPVGQDERLSLALVMASRWVDRVVGYNAGEVGADPAVPVDATLIALPVTVLVKAVDVGVRNATLVAAARFLRSPDAPFSVLGGMGDLAIRVGMDIPEAELHLLGLHDSWGIA